MGESKAAPASGAFISRVLIVEDDTIISSALRMLFERRKWEVRVAATLAQARQLLERKPDWAVVDLMLPDGNGMDLIHEIHRRQLSTRVIITTGVRERHRLEAMEKLPGVTVLLKPISFSDLLKVVETT